jgi:hypothetical protein
MMLKGMFEMMIIHSKFSRCFFFFNSEDEISLNKGVWVNVLQKKNDGWWLVQYEKQRGWFPSNYLIEVRDLFVLIKLKLIFFPFI